MKTIGEATRFILTRFWVRARIGPYVVTTIEVRPSAFETNVTWGEAGPEVASLGSARAFTPAGAAANHEAICKRVEAGTGRTRAPVRIPPAA